MTEPTQPQTTEELKKSPVYNYIATLCPNGVAMQELSTANIGLTAEQIEADIEG